MSVSGAPLRAPFRWHREAGRRTCWRHLAAFGLTLLPALALATDVAVAGLFSDKAVLVINGGEPRIVRVGASTVEGIRLLSVGEGRATLLVDGKQQSVALGGRSVRTTATSRPDSVLLQADKQGHYFAPGRINDGQVQFLVDTGATVVSLGRSEAARLGIPFEKGVPGYAMTANGKARLWKVTLDRVSVGDITLYDVPAAVHDWDMPVNLLGMSFLSRVDMSREADRMVLQRRF